MTQYAVKVTVNRYGQEDDLQFVSMVEMADGPNEAIDFAEELVRRADDMRWTDDWQPGHSQAKDF